jgi:hypothetical protein
MGNEALPLILSELKQRPDQWFAALKEIAKLSPLPEADRADPRKARDAWLAWGKEKGLID